MRMTFSYGTPLLVNVTKAVMVAAPIALLYFLLHKGQKKKRIISAGCMVLCAVYLVWFYFPYRYPSAPENVQQFEVTSEHGISYDPEHVCVMLEPQDGPTAIICPSPAPWGRRALHTTRAPTAWRSPTAGSTAGSPWWPISGSWR